jgi:hypothetical protein
MGTRVMAVIAMIQIAATSFFVQHELVLNSSAMARVLARIMYGLLGQQAGHVS